MGPEGFEPPLRELKARCAAVTPRPRVRAWRRFSRCCMWISFGESRGTELNRRFRRKRTMCFRYTTRRSAISDPCGIRTQPGRLERPVTSPEVERAMSAHRLRVRTRGFFSERAVRRSNPSLLVFSQALNRLSYQARETKKPGVFRMTPGFESSRRPLGPMSGAQSVRRFSAPQTWTRRIAGKELPT
jgi:hypothetical protein